MSSPESSADVPGLRRLPRLNKIWLGAERSVSLGARLSQRPWPIGSCDDVARRLFLVLNAAALAIYLMVGWRSGYLGHLESLFFASYDSQTYRAVADWIFQGGSVPRAAAWRPFLYPLLMGAAERSFGIRGAWVLNIALWLGTLNFAAAAAYRLTRRLWSAAAVFSIVACNASLIILSFQGLTEVMVACLLAMWAFGLTHLTRHVRAREVVWAFLPLTLLSVVKPSFEILLAVVLLVLITELARTPPRKYAVGALAGCLLPIVVQLFLMVHFNHYLGLSTIGEETIRGYYVSQVYMSVQPVSGIADARVAVAGYSTAQIVRLLSAHPIQSVTIFWMTVLDNLWVGSNFVSNATHPTLARAIEATNRAYILLHFVMFPAVIVAVCRTKSATLGMLCIGVLAIFVTAGVSFGQGDRLTVIALPLWSVAYAVAIAAIIRQRQLTSKTRPTAQGAERPPSGERRGVNRLRQDRSEESVQSSK
jgi:hypothetical protein